MVFSYDAHRDYQGILISGINEWGEAAALKYQERIEEALDSIAHFPFMGRMKEGVHAELRVVGVAQHRIYYRFDAETVEIVRILHSRMDQTHHLDVE